MKNIISNTSARGFGLTETILVLALGLGIATAALAGFTPASTATDVQTATQQLDTLRNKITSAYVSSPDFAGLNTNSAVNQGWTASSSPWGAISINPEPVGGIALDGWEVSLTNVPADACAKLLTYEQAAGKWEELLVNGVPVSDINTACVETVQITFGKWGGTRSNAYVHPLCFDHSREWVEANGSPAPGYCPSDPLKYNPAQA